MARTMLTMWLLSFAIRSLIAASIFAFIATGLGPGGTLFTDTLKSLKTLSQLGNVNIKSPFGGDNTTNSADRNSGVVAAVAGIDIIEVHQQIGFLQQVRLLKRWGKRTSPHVLHWQWRASLATLASVNNWVVWDGFWHAKSINSC